ncbi:MAG: hypothetical protein CMJ35_05985 [Phycisphaerae bacterium]|nr:hypothetical protein [Phycisphaerae bacterium]MBM91148.1 hypothetical protein [Phycisphaerae bacterium]HCT45288.1 hypothetical protein [Phycisphaerales bacterium]|tara:strand:+ start:26 stop:748 length:723 start_codon:yes stop_codon:yes gene_type:complete
MNKSTAIASAALLGLAGTAFASDVTVGDYTFDLGQFAGASVNYRANTDGGHVTFDGKLWDNAVGVNNYTIGELAAGQYGSDPGDQLSLNSRGTQGQDWFTLNFAMSLTVGDAANDTFVFYEITSSNSGVDTEGTSWEISFNGGAFFNASLGDATFLDNSALSVENVNQVAFDLTDFGLSMGDTLTSVTVRNLDTGSGTSDPDFIFGGLENGLTVVPLPPAVLASLGLLAGCAGVRQYRRR